MSEAHAAARTIVRRATDPTEARQLLDMLGLIADDGTLAVGEPAGVWARVLNAPTVVPRNAVYKITDRPRVSTAPEALRNLPVVHVPPMQARPSQAGNDARKAPCGTTAALRRHKRNGETCSVCEGARDERVAATHRRLPEEHGTVRGSFQHFRRGDKLCDPCREAGNAARRVNKAAQKAKAA